MTILVDELRTYPTTLRCFKKGSAHLTFVDPSTVDDLHAFALGIEQQDMQREWSERLVAHEGGASLSSALIMKGFIFFPTPISHN